MVIVLVCVSVVSPETGGLGGGGDDTYGRTSVRTTVEDRGTTSFVRTWGDTTVTVVTTVYVCFYLG